MDQTGTARPAGCVQFEIINEASGFQGLVMPGLTQHLPFPIFPFEKKSPGQARCDKTLSV